MGKPGETSIWKKEISFRRKPGGVVEDAGPVEDGAEAVAGEAGPSGPEQTSIWKKEISFRRKPGGVVEDAGPVEDGAEAVAGEAGPSGPEQTSIWKKEISFRRKPGGVVEDAGPVEDGAEAVAGEAGPSGPEQTSIWKKEISFRRKPGGVVEDAGPVEDGAEAVAGEAGPSGPEQTSIWKKEISFRRKPKGAAADPPAGTEPRPAPDLVGGLPRPLSQQMLDPVVLRPVEVSLTPLLGVPVTPTPLEPSVFQADAENVEYSDPAEAVAEDQVAPDRAFGDSAGDSPDDPAALAVADELTPSAVPPPFLVPAAPRPLAPVPDPEPVPPADDAAPVGEAEVEQASAVGPEESPPLPGEPAEPPPAADHATSDRRRGKRAGRGEPNRRAYKRVVGLKIGASQIAAAEVVNRGGPRVIRMARMPLERGIVVGGELRESEELSAALKTFFRKNKLPRNCVRLGISNNRIGVRTFEIAGIDDEKQLANAIRFRAQEALPIPLDEAVLDHRILDERTDEQGVRVRRVLLVVAHRELVERYVAACRKAGLKLIGIDLEAFALLRALADPAGPPAEDAAVVCISIGHDRSTLAVSDGRVCEFTRVLAWGGSALDIALARVLDLTPLTAEPIKRELSLDEQGESAGLDARRAGEARAAMAAELQAFAREIVASLRFYQEQANSLGIGELVVTGGASACGGLATELERLIGLPVRVADPFERVNVPRKLRNRNGSAGSFAVAVGLGIED